mmetsp:Transcript_31464/g.75168  ORF Transcript_31464/g.75168 Transcript_31464/m.75168 type:complete len:218 (+) Transcript_31464:2314-2967(+)
MASILLGLCRFSVDVLLGRSPTAMVGLNSSCRSTSSIPSISESNKELPLSPTTGPGGALNGFEGGDPLFAVSAKPDVKAGVCPLSIISLCSRVASPSVKRVPPSSVSVPMGSEVESIPSTEFLSLIGFSAPLPSAMIRSKTSEVLSSLKDWSLSGKCFLSSLPLLLSGTPSSLPKLSTKHDSMLSKPSSSSPSPRWRSTSTSQPRFSISSMSMPALP